MYIKLTRLDDTPIWLNASFIVTIEPRKGGGSVVVPIGDGLDYDVKESVACVLTMLGDAPAAVVVPVPPPPGLAPKPAYALPGAEAPSSGEVSAPVPEVVPDEAASEAAAEPAAKPVRKTTRSRAKTKTAAAETAAEPTEKKPRARRTKKPSLDLSADEIARLRKLAPGSVRKLVNTLTAQFRVVEPEPTVRALEAHGVLTIDRDHVVWQ